MAKSEWSAFDQLPEKIANIIHSLQIHGFLMSQVPRTDLSLVPSLLQQIAACFHLEGSARQTVC
ncbi:hypothetical protein LEMLEM_LOCUS1923, partial [Lemmus lemmus]